MLNVGNVPSKLRWCINILLYYGTPLLFQSTPPYPIPTPTPTHTHTLNIFRHIVSVSRQSNIDCVPIKSFVVFSIHSNTFAIVRHFRHNEEIQWTNFTSSFYIQNCNEYLDHYSIVFIIDIFPSSAKHIKLSLGFVYQKYQAHAWISAKILMIYLLVVCWINYTYGLHIWTAHKLHIWTANS